MPNPSLASRVVPGKSRREDFPLFLDRCALLVIDIQEYLSKPTTDEEKESYLFDIALPQTVSNLGKIIPAFRKIRDENETGCEVIFTFLEALTKDCRDVSLDYKLSGPQLASLPNSSSNPAKFLASVEPSGDGKGDIKIPKTSCSVFCSTNLRYVLQNLQAEQLVITGQLTDQCVESAVRDAADLGLFVTVVDDACAATSEENHSKGLSGMKGFCRVVKTDQILKELELAKVNHSSS